MIGSRILVAVALLTLQFGVGAALAADKVKAVASFSILADLIRQIGGGSDRCHGASQARTPTCTRSNLRRLMQRRLLQPT